MLAFLMNNLSTILVGGVLLIALVLIVLGLRKKGSCSSCSSCAGCSSSGVCHPEEHK